MLKLTLLQQQTLDYGTRDQVDLNTRLLQAASLGASTPGWNDMLPEEQQHILRLLIQGHLDDQIYS